MVDFVCLCFEGFICFVFVICCGLGCLFVLFCFLDFGWVLTWVGCFGCCLGAICFVGFDGLLVVDCNGVGVVVLCNIVVYSV